MTTIVPHEMEFFFRDPRFAMTVFGRLIVRVVSYVSYLFVIAAAMIFLFSDLLWMKLLGIFLALFLIDRLFHLYEADKHLNELPSSGRINVAQFTAPSALAALLHSFERSHLGRHNFFLEFSLALADLKEIKEGLTRLEVSPDEFKHKIEELLFDPAHQVNAPKNELLGAIERISILALQKAIRGGHRFVIPVNFFSALSSIEDGMVKRIFQIFSIEPNDLERALLMSSISNSFIRGRSRRFKHSFEYQRLSGHKVMNRAWTAQQTPLLDTLSVDFTDLARRGEVGFLIGHEGEYERLQTTLARTANPNAILVGEAGIGKESIIGHLALNIVRDRVPPPLFDKRLVALHLSNLVAGAEPAALQERLKRIVEEIYVSGNIILYIPDIHNLVKTSGTAYLSAADALLPIINSNLFPIIGSTYPKEFKEYLEPRNDFTSLFEMIRVGEISEEDAEKFLVYEGAFLERTSKVLISFGALKAAARLAKRYFHEKPLPGSAVELLKNALADAESKREKVLAEASVVRAAEKRVNIPIHKASEKEAETLLNLEAFIHERFVNQEEAVKAVADALRGYRSGLTRKGGPIATFLFVGPTGVGKTELSKIIAKLQFGSEKFMTRFDMSEYQDKQNFFRFVGSPDGKMSGALTDAVIERPYSLILLDEFEKAYPDILDLFLPLFDEGRLTDTMGRTVDFTNTIIIATSNAHSEFVKAEIDRGNSVAGIAEALKKKLTDYFKPELLNRFSKIIVFRSLNEEELETVADINLRDLRALLEEQGVTIVFDREVIRKVAMLGYDPSFGARPLRQVIDERLRAPLAEKLLKKEIIPGAHVRVSLKGEEIEFVTEG